MRAIQTFINTRAYAQRISDRFVSVRTLCTARAGVKLPPKQSRRFQCVITTSTSLFLSSSVILCSFHHNISFSLSPDRFSSSLIWIRERHTAVHKNHHTHTQLTIIHVRSLLHTFYDVHNVCGHRVRGGFHFIAVTPTAAIEPLQALRRLYLCHAHAARSFGFHVTVNLCTRII